MKRNFSMRKPSKPFLHSEKDFVKFGWLKKQGGTFKTMKRRYFVLVDDVLYYFTNHTRNYLKGQINLRNLELSELEEDRTNNEYTFSILPEIGKETVNGTHIRYQLVCNDKDDAESWMQHIKQKMYLRKGGGLFGTPLSTVMLHLKQEYCYVPRVVFECCQRIRSIGMDEEGIFRKNGQQSLVYKMKDNVDRANYNWEDVDIHTVCSLLKLYLRELPEPLIPFSHYDNLKAVGYRIEIGEDLNLVRDKLLMLPLPNLQLLKYLCEFLLEVSTHPDNRMEISSLAKVFSPNILRDQDTDPYVEESTSSIISITVAAFIKSQKEMFLFEYEPLEKYDGDSTNDDDTYSMFSTFSNMSFSTQQLPFDDINCSPLSLPREHKKKDRSSSVTFSNNTADDRLSESSLIFSQSEDHIENLSITFANDDYNEKTPISTKRFTLTNGSRTKSESTVVCDKCQHLERNLMLVTEERNRLQNICDVKSKTCLQLQEEIEYLRLQLTESRRLRAENPSDLSDMLVYFDMNR